MKSMKKKKAVKKVRAERDPLKQIKVTIPRISDVKEVIDWKRVLPNPFKEVG